MTDIEKIMRDALLGAGIPFHQEVPFRNGFIADFEIVGHKLIVECDGRQHSRKDRQKYDRYRDYRFRRMGYDTLRFDSKQIRENIDHCVDKIKAAIAACVMSRCVALR